MTINEQLERGLLRCPCSRKAVKIVARSGVCPRCLAWDKGAQCYTKPESPDAKYAEKFFAPDYGHKTEIVGP